MVDSGFDNCTKLENFLRASNGLAFNGGGKRQKYDWVKLVLNRLVFRDLAKKERGIVRAYIQKVTGYSTSQLSRLITKYLKGELVFKSYQRHQFTTRYSANDILLLVKTDNAHLRLNGQAIKAILLREYLVFGKIEYQNIAQISVSHIYNLRQTRIYVSHSLTFKHTQAVQRAIGERSKPDPQGKPGYIRIDTVHQGDLSLENAEGVQKGGKIVKGVYHINSVDEVTQWEIVACVEQISESYLEPILKLILEQYPFVILEFHADNGSEYINKTVAQMLNKLLIKLTKSRARQSNDNALVESKNGSIIRKHMGYFYINQKYAPDINDFYIKYFNPYLNFHRPCGFATIATNSKGKQKKTYKSQNYLTPFEALKKIANFAQYLKPEITPETLEQIAMDKSDNDYAIIMEQEKEKLFNKMDLSPVDI